MSPDTNYVFHSIPKAMWYEYYSRNTNFKPTWLILGGNPTLVFQKQLRNSWLLPSVSNLDTSTNQLFPSNKEAAGAKQPLTHALHNQLHHRHSIGESAECENPRRNSSQQTLEQVLVPLSSTRLSRPGHRWLTRRGCMPHSKNFSLHPVPVASRRKSCWSL